MRIKKVFLQTTLVKTLQEFYSSILELQVLTENENEIKIKIGSSDLIFTEAKNGEPFYHVAMIADFVNWHAKSVYFFDPAGNILELIARFALNISMKDDFSSKQFLSISEVGLVFNYEEFEQRTSELLSQFSLSYFPKQPPMAHFRAVGDDEGLFIVVPEHRNWYPTDKPSDIFPIQIEFINAGKKFEIKFLRNYCFYISETTGVWRTYKFFSDISTIKLARFRRLINKFGLEFPPCT
jgi:catechol-2,3-dioxygenase